MFDPVLEFFSMLFEWLGKAIGKLLVLIMSPFVWVRGWYTKRGWIVRGSVGLVLLVIFISYSYFLWQTQRWSGFNPGYVASYDFKGNQTEPGEKVQNDSGSADVCGRSSIIQVSRDLIDFNVNRNVWIPSMLVSKLGLFGLDWKRTPFFDNKAAFQRGINEALRRASRQFVDTLGRVRGTSRIDPDLQTAREKLNYPEEAWYISRKGPQVTTPTRYREAIVALDSFNSSLSKCEAQFDVRADNLQKFLDEVASAIGSTSDILRGQMEQSNAGWFDSRADDRFWFAYGQLYAYYGMLAAARSDFKSVTRERNLTRIWDRAEEQLLATLDIQPMIISNGGEASWIMPSHLATMGFYLLRVRANLTEMRDVLRN